MGKQQSTRLYDNCKVYNLDNKLMYCSNKYRAEWYIKRNLAKIISENPFAIQLLFKCNGDGHSDDPYYLQDLINQCVVCGIKEKLTHHHVCPFTYRKHFPTDLKNHSHHDVLLVCIPCHDKYENLAIEFKKVLEKEYDAPVDGIHLDKDKWKRDFHTARDARILVGVHKDKIPDERKQFLLSRIKNNIGKEPSYEELLELAKIKPEHKVITHSQIVVGKLTTYDLLDEFCARWRKHFVETMTPQFLPKFWDVDKKLNENRSRNI